MNVGRQPVTDDNERIKSESDRNANLEEVAEKIMFKFKFPSISR